MKKAIALMLCILLLVVGLAACKKDVDEPQVVTPEASYAVVTFVIDPELYEFEAPSPLTVEVGTVAQLPFPEGSAAIDPHNDLCWCTDELGLEPYDTTKPVTADVTLYLGEIGKLYAISYTGLEGFDVVGTYVYTYRYCEYEIDADAPTLPTVIKDGYYTGLYCVELGGHYQKVPTNAGRDLTFTAPKPRAFEINYSYGKDVDAAAVSNPNPAVYSAVGETLTLQAPTCTGKEFYRWVVKTWGQTKTFVVEGKEVTLIPEGTVVTALSYEMIRWGYQNFTVEAEWK